MNNLLSKEPLLNPKESKMIAQKAGNLVSQGFH
jgi:hypothetical protein